MATDLADEERPMPGLRVHNFAISLDGRAAGPDQGPEHPLGLGGSRPHEWALATRSFQAIHGREGGEKGLGDRFVARGVGGIGATITGRNMFGPVRGPWPDASRTGVWGYPVFLTHRPRPRSRCAGAPPSAS